jgi:nitrogen fixation NifU-like protein
MMTDSVKGKTLAEVETLFEKFHQLVTGRDDPSTFSSDLGKLMVFGGVRDFPVRVKCATLAWHTLRSAIDRRAETVSTE